jgi:hypothetical protein
MATRIIETAKTSEKERAKAELKKLFAGSGYQAYTMLRHVSSSGMFRRISVYVIEDNQPLCIDYLIGKLGNYKRDKENEGLRVSGCGMDMGFAVVYDTSGEVFDDEEEVKRIAMKLGRTRNGEPETSGSYLVRQKWM